MFSYKMPRPIPMRKKRGHCAEDKAPPYVQRMRKAVCDEWLATGRFNPDLLDKLKQFADVVNGPKTYKRKPAESHIIRGPQHGKTKTT